MRKRFMKRAAYLLATSMMVTTICACQKKEANTEPAEVATEITTEESTAAVEIATEASTEAATEATEVSTEASTEIETPEDETYSWNPLWEFAEFSKIHDSDVTLYRSQSENRLNIVVAVNAGHGTEGGSSVKTKCHPDGSEKVTGGTTGAGATESYAVSTGTDLSDGTPEAVATLAVAQLFKEELLDHGFDVLMIRETKDTQLDNIARTIFSNQYADYHIAIHYDGTESDKGAFYMSVPDVDSYRNMYPVSEVWQKHNELGEALIEGLREEGIKIWSDGNMEMDLTQTSFSTIPSVDMEIGDAVSDHSEEAQREIAKGLVLGMEKLVK